jgi:hypothetical protein
VTVYSFILSTLLNGVRKQKIQNIHHKTLHKGGLNYEVVKVGPFCRTSSQRHNLNNMYCAIFFCRLAAVGQVDITRDWCWHRVMFGALDGYFPSLKQIVNNYVQCAMCSMCKGY